MSPKKSKNQNQTELLAELLNRFSTPPSSVGLKESFFSQQSAFIRDPAKFKAALCSRRAGKSVAAVGYLILSALENPDSNGLFGALTRKSAKKIAWKEIHRFNRKYKLKIHFNETELTATFPNGSEIQCVGLNDLTAAEGLRGQHYKVVVLDESASYGPHFSYVIDDILTPTLIDDDGTLCLIGTPSAACTGPFYESTHKGLGGYSLHKWTILDNPHIPHADKWLQEYRKKMGWSEDNPIYLREWRGTWIQSDVSLVYKFREDRNTIELSREHKHGDWQYLLGVDLGYDDATAFAVLAFSSTSPNLHVVDTFKQSGMIPSEVAKKVVEYQEKWEVVSTVCDTGGLGKAIVEEMKKRYGISIKAAEKRNKYEYIELINSDFHEGKIKIGSGLKELIDELKMLQWEEGTRKEDGRFENHICDALLYAWRESAHWGYRATIAPMKYGTDAFWEKHIRDVEEKLKKQDEKPWYES